MTTPAEEKGGEQGCAAHEKYHITSRLIEALDVQGSIIGCKGTSDNCANTEKFCKRHPSLKN